MKTYCFHLVFDYLLYNLPFSVFFNRLYRRIAEVTVPPEFTFLLNPESDDPPESSDLLKITTQLQ